MTRPYNPANRPVLRTRDANRYADEAAAFMAALPPRPYPLTGIGLALLLLWLGAALLGLLPAWIGG